MEIEVGDEWIQVILNRKLLTKKKIIDMISDRAYMVDSLKRKSGRIALNWAWGKGKMRFRDISIKDLDLRSESSPKSQNPSTKIGEKPTRKPKGSAKKLSDSTQIKQDWLEQIKRIPMEPMTLAFSPDGESLVLTKWAFGYQLFKLESGELTLDKNAGEPAVIGNALEITDAIAGPDGQVILSYADQMIRVRDKFGFRIKEMAPRPLGQKFFNLRYSQPERWVLAQGPTQLGIWDVPSGKELKRIEVRALDLDLHPNGQDVVTIDADHFVHIWNARSGVTVSQFPDPSKKVNPRHSRPTAGTCSAGLRPIANWPW